MEKGVNPDLHTSVRSDHSDVGSALVPLDLGIVDSDFSRLDDPEFAVEGTTLQFG